MSTIFNSSDSVAQRPKMCNVWTACVAIQNKRGEHDISFLPLLRNLSHLCNIRRNEGMALSLLSNLKSIKNLADVQVIAKRK